MLLSLGTLDERARGAEKWGLNPGKEMIPITCLIPRFEPYCSPSPPRPTYLIIREVALRPSARSETGF